MFHSNVRAGTVPLAPAMVVHSARPAALTNIYRSGAVVALFHNTKTGQDMGNGVELLDSILGASLFNTFAEVIVTDRGGEFTFADRFESRQDGTCRSRIFYCDPMQGGQKGSLEVNHELLRYILPKETDLRSLGLTGQAPLLLAISHVNSGPDRIGG